MVTLGLLRALTDDGLTVQPFKCGPDYIDPGFHGAACGRASFNLDSWTMEGPLIDHIASAAKGADMVLAEGAMGLFDGVAGRGAAGHGTAADIARRMGWPVLLVLDISGQAQSCAATALGFARIDPGVNVAGVILNRVASPRHERLARAGLEAVGIRVFGAVPRRPDLSLPERHLGLVQAGEHPDLEQAMAGYAALMRDHVDLHAIRNAAQAHALGRGRRLLHPQAQRIAVAQDMAFSFLYPHVLDEWRRAGSDILPFSPLADEPPATDADLVWLPGGYPELHAGAIASAGHFLSGLRRHAAHRPIHGECGGYMVLGEALVDRDGTAHRMAGLLDLVTSHAERRLHLGYRRAELLAPLCALGAGTMLRGHEFHYSTITRQGDAPLMRITDADGATVAETGSRRGLVSGTFFHMIASEP